MSRQVLGVGLGYSNYKFQSNTTYCWNQATDPGFQVSQDFRYPMCLFADETDLLD